MIRVKVSQLLVSKAGFVVVLKGIEDTRVLHIFIGAAEAQAIAIRLNDVEVPRPLTHDLLKSVIDALGAKLLRVEITDLREGTFYARLILSRDGAEMEIDSRPSDAMALALRCSVPVFVAEKVMDEAGRSDDEDETSPPQAVESGLTAEESRTAKATALIGRLKKDLDKAIEEERYEDAARIRDEIKRLENIH